MTSEWKSSRKRSRIAEQVIEPSTLPSKKITKDDYWTKRSTKSADSMKYGSSSTDYRQVYRTRSTARKRPYTTFKSEKMEARYISRKRNPKIHSQGCGFNRKQDADSMKQDRLVIKINFSTIWPSFSSVQTAEEQLPTYRELQSEGLPKTLKANITDGSFSSVSEYLSIFIGLLREDFVHPLREALHGPLHGLCIPKERTTTTVYEAVRVKSKIPIDNYILCQLRFEWPGNIKWKFSRNLTYGNLVCLSNDNFVTIHFATVADRNLDDLNEKEITVKVIGDAAIDLAKTSNTVYRMIESPSYYEAYAPVLERLKAIEQNKPAQIPFQKHIVYCQAKVEVPLYLKDPVTQVDLNLQGVICSCESLKCEHSAIGVKEVEQMSLPTDSNCKLDQSQIRALCTALTRELVLIQGPPGTGKTYIGLKIVQALLLNKSIWTQSNKKIKTPIMVVCFTNHALDQFLEGLVRIADTHPIEIRRLGGRSKSSILEPYNIKEFVRQECREQRIYLRSSQKLLTLQRKIVAMNDFLDGKFIKSMRNIKMYSYFLSGAICDEMMEMCSFNITLPDLSRQGLVKVKPNKDRMYRNPIQDQIEAERQVFFEHDNVNDDGSAALYESESLGQFVRYFHTVEPLSEKIAHKFLRNRTVYEDKVAFQRLKYCLIELCRAWQKEAQCTAEKSEVDNQKRHLIRMKCLRQADVIGLTTTGAAKYGSAMIQMRSRICIVEEAAEVLEPQIIAALSEHTQHLILIGDHKQLRPKTNIYEIAHKYKLEVSLFERLAINNFPVVTLEVQHRMRPEISCIVSKNIYGGALKDSNDVHNYEDVKGIQHNIFFVNHHRLESTDDNTSPHNTHEAYFVISLSKYLLKNGYDSKEITIITPYEGQLLFLRTQIEKELRSNQLSTVESKIVEEVNKIHVTTIDSYQGEENKIILLSMVRSNQERRAGFTKNENRVCVALSRAKVGFYCIGNFDMLQKCSRLWKSIVSDLERNEHLGNQLPLKCVNHNNITEVSCEKDFLLVSEGGCNNPCSKPFPNCSHICAEKCHPHNIDHLKLCCSQPCEKLCDKNKHKCKAVCGLECPPCDEPEDKQIPNCGHQQKVPCSMPPSEFPCKVECDKKLPCDHPCRLTCGEICTSKPCRSFVKKIWPCGHEAQKECHTTDLEYSFTCSFPCNETLVCGHRCKGKCGKCLQGRLHAPCKEKCEKIFVCGHKCSDLCAVVCPPCEKASLCESGTQSRKSCHQRCQWKCEHHNCKLAYGEVCHRSRCSQPCKKMFKCGHECIGLCGERCPTRCKICNKDLIFSGGDTSSHYVILADCGHVYEYEVSNFDEQVNRHNSFKIDWKWCPTCKKTIIASPRYTICKPEQQDMNVIKILNHHNLSKQEKQLCIENAVSSCDKIAKIVKLPNLLMPSLERSLSKWLHKITDVKFLTSLSDPLLECSAELLQVVLQALIYAEKLKSQIAGVQTYDPDQKNRLPLETNINVLFSQTLQFLERITSYLKFQPFTDQMTSDIALEIRRITMLGELYLILYALPCDKQFPDDQLLLQLQKYERLGIKTSKITTQDIFETTPLQLDEISQLLHVPLQDPSKQYILKQAQSWHKQERWGHR